MHIIKPFILTALLAGTAFALVQPASIPGSYSVTDQPMPPLQDIVTRPAPEMPVYGLYSGQAEFRMHLADIKAVGWKSIRLGELSDTEMMFICQNGFEVMSTLGGSKRDNEASDEAFLSKELAHYREQVRRYGPGGTLWDDRPAWNNVPVKYWEVRNEPNLHYFYENATNAQREALYARLLVAAYDTIGHYSPLSEVVGFSMAGAAGSGPAFVNNVHAADAGVAASYDILSMHPYQQGNPPECDVVKNWGSFSECRTLNTTLTYMDNHGAATDRIWYTELGWAIPQSAGGAFETDPARAVTQRLQAAYVCRQYALAMRLGVERVFVMFINDADGFNGGFFANGTKEWRESAYAVQAMIRHLPNPKLTGAVYDGGATGNYAYTFDPDGTDTLDEEAVMVWNVEGPADITVPTESGQEYHVVDMLGDTTETVTPGTQLTVAAGPCPVYVMPARAATSGLTDRGRDAVIRTGDGSMLYTLDGKAVRHEYANAGVYLRRTADGITTSIIIP